MGYAESSYDLDDLYGKFLTLADKKGQVFDYDLEALAFFSQIHEEPEHFKLEYLGVQSGSSVMATASVKLKVGQRSSAKPPPATARWTRSTSASTASPATRSASTSTNSRVRGRQERPRPGRHSRTVQGPQIPWHGPGHRHNRVFRPGVDPRDQQHLACRSGGRTDGTQRRKNRQDQYGERVSMSSYRIAVLPGDGIGPEVMAEAVKVLEKVQANLASPSTTSAMTWAASPSTTTAPRCPRAPLQAARRPMPCCSARWAAPREHLPPTISRSAAPCCPARPLQAVLQPASGPHLHRPRAVLAAACRHLGSRF